MTGAIPNIPLRNWRTQQHLSRAEMADRINASEAGIADGLTAFGYDRKTEASLLSRAADLDHVPAERYPDERLADDFHERYIAARTALRRRAHSHG